MPRSGSSSIAEIVPNSSERARSRRARQIVHADREQDERHEDPGLQRADPSRRAGRGRPPSCTAAAARRRRASRSTPHGATSHVASPKIIPNPTDISDGPSSFSGGPRWNRLVSRRSPNTAISEKPKITHVVGCVNAAAMPTRNIALRAPQEVLRRCEEREDQREEVQDRDVVEVADVRRRHEQRRGREHDQQEQQRVPVRAPRERAEREAGQDRDAHHQERAERVQVDPGDPLQDRARQRHASPGTRRRTSRTGPSPRRSARGSRASSGSSATCTRRGRASGR